MIPQSAGVPAMGLNAGLPKLAVADRQQPNDGAREPSCASSDPDFAADEHGLKCGKSHLGKTICGHPHGRETIDSAGGLVISPWREVSVERLERWSWID